MAANQDIIAMRNSRQPVGPRLEYTSEEWHEFVSGIKKSDFYDLLN